MAIQPFAMQGQSANIMLPSQALANGERLKALSNNNAMFDMEVADKQAAQASQAKLNELFQQSGGDLSKMRAGVQDYSTAMKLDKQIGDNAKLQGEGDKVRLESGLKKLEYGSQLLQGATPENWQDIRRQFQEVTGTDIGEQYDQGKVSMMLQQGLSMREKLENEWKQKGFELQSRGQDIQLRGQGITLRGQDISHNDRVAGLMPKYVQVNGQTFMQDPNTGQLSQPTMNGQPVAPKSAAPKPLPPTALKMQQEALDAIGTAGTINADLGSIGGMIDQGKLEFGPVSNLRNRALNAAGSSTENSRNFATFQSTLEKLRNDSLRLNKGVQTDGDAQRAWNELLQNINDKDVVKQRLGEIQKINERGAALQQMNVDQIRANYGADPLDASGRLQQESAIGMQNEQDDHSNLWN